MSEAKAGERLTYGQLYERIKALAAKVEAAASKSTLVHMIATRTVDDAYYRGGNAAAIEEAGRKLLEDLAEWSKVGWDVNRGKRTDRMIARLREMSEALAEGRPLPPRKRRRRRSTGRRPRFKLGSTPG